MIINPEETLRLITNAEFEPLKAGDKDLIITNFADITGLPLTPGSEVEVEGFVTYVSNIHKGTGEEQDQDIHFNISPEGSESYLVCEIQNADETKHKKPLDDAKRNGRKVKVKGVFRLFLEHIYQTRQKNQFPHIFELHPVKSVSIEGVKLPDITMDCPDMDNWRNNNSIYEMKLQNDGTVLFKKLGGHWKSFLESSIGAEFDGTNLILKNVHTVGHNYIFMDGYFSKTQDSFSEGDPYLFEIKSPYDDSIDSININSVVLPGTPAYETAKIFHDNPPEQIITAVAVRNLNIIQLINNVYMTMLCPVYRLEQENL